MSKKIKKNTPSAPQVDIADMGRTSWFSAHKSGATEKRLITHTPAFLFGVMFLWLLFSYKKFLAFVTLVVGKIVDFLNSVQTILELLGVESIDVATIDCNKVAIITIAVVTIILLLCEWSSVSQEKERMRKAANTYYYFYKDMVEIVDQNKKKREAIRTLNGVVSCRIDTPKTGLFMAILVSILKFNTREIWKRREDYSDVIITTTGNPLETIVLNDVENPGKLLENIRKHYPTATNLSVGNSFNL